MSCTGKKNHQQYSCVQTVHGLTDIQTNFSAVQNSVSLLSEEASINTAKLSA